MIKVHPGKSASSPEIKPFHLARKQFKHLILILDYLIHHYQLYIIKVVLSSLLQLINCIYIVELFPAEEFFYLGSDVWGAHQGFANQDGSYPAFF